MPQPSAASKPSSSPTFRCDVANVRTGELVRALDITPQQERELLSRLARRNLIARVCRGCTSFHHGCHQVESGAQRFPGADYAPWRPSGRYQVCGPVLSTATAGTTRSKPTRCIQQSHHRPTEDRFDGNDAHQTNRQTAGETRLSRRRMYRRCLLLAGPVPGGRRV